MKVSEVLAPDIPPQVRYRGQDYYQEGRVLVIEGGKGYIEAEVKGSTVYNVGVDTMFGSFDYECSCPMGDDGELCKHVWATILAGEDLGYLGTRNAPASDWQRRLEYIQTHTGIRRDPWPERRQIVYTVEPQASTAAVTLILALYMRERKAKGVGWNQRKELRLDRKDIPELPDPADREILSLIAGASEYSPWSLGGAGVGARRSVGWPLNTTVLPLICATGRSFIVDQGGHEIPLEWDDGPPWTFELRLESQSDQLTLWGVLRRNEEEVQVTEPRLLVPGLVFFKGVAARLDAGPYFEWMSQLRQRGVIVAPARDADAVLARLLEDPAAPPLRVPESLSYTVSTGTPSPVLKVRNPRQTSTLEAEPVFSYEQQTARAGDPRMVRFEATTRTVFRRNADAEASLMSQLEEAGIKRLTRNEGWSMPAKDLPRVARTLIPHGWKIEAEGKLFRAARSTRSEVTSGVDWFELSGEIDYGGATASLPAILAAARRGDQVVELGDGTFGLLPEDWLARFGALVDLGDTTAEGVRFGKNQAVLLDALLAAEPEVKVDEEFERARQRLASFEGIQPAEQPPAFTGELRDYQREGVGWMHFLRAFGFGGCLADDMGVGKTAQVLALLETRRALRAGEASSVEPVPDSPSLVVVPRSLIFNWKQEAAKFTPKLRVLDHTGIERSFEGILNADVVLTTYGTLRRDILQMRNMEFDYVILDEAQAVRNAATDSAKAVRLLKARHRLALTGTPVENHLGDLWSLFEFLNPGMLGSGRAFDALAASTRNGGPESTKVLGQVLRPFILRRTKQQVARELPEKTEQTILCELKPAQRRIYNEVRDYYRASLLHQIDAQGMGKTKIQVLEALLRLRQAACHPGLIDKKHTDAGSAKLDLLVDRITETVEEGHKTLVFSQFTSLLAIVQDRLRTARIPYEYLDGKTRDREARVNRFQTDEQCRIFLISLKAGGLGLNLTAAEYVFLLDPWWNPAVESQAIDRAHRIGQKRQVFAYRLIAKDTVEEKVLELQKSKRELAAAIIGEENRVLADLKREDLELLLS